MTRYAFSLCQEVLLEKGASILRRTTTSDGDP